MPTRNSREFDMTEAGKIQRTKTMARIVGPYCLIMASALLVRHETLPAILSGFMQEPALLLLTAIFTVIVGLVIVGAHHHWNSLTAGVVSFVGISATVKGAWLAIAPQLGGDLTVRVLTTAPVLLGGAVVALAIGLWLTAAGWSFSRRRPATTYALP